MNEGLAVDLAGYQVQDAAGNTFTFPSWNLPTGGRVVVWGGGAGDSSGPAWSMASAWNNGGDAAGLLDPSGALLDRIAYGSHGTTPPPGHTEETAGPAPGKAIVWDGAWSSADPTPGTAPGALAGTAGGEALNVPPTVAVGHPVWASPGSTVEVEVAVADQNGPADVVGWEIRSGGALLDSGAGANGTAYLAAPSALGSWPLDITATDSSGANGTNSSSIDIRVSPLVLTMPPNGTLDFPAFYPAATDVTSGSFNLYNDDTSPVDAIFDISDLSGPGTIALANNLRILWDDGTTVTPILYDGPLTPLPTMAPGASVDVSLQMISVPVPLAAGTYGTTFTVVA